MLIFLISVRHCGMGDCIEGFLCFSKHKKSFFLICKLKGNQEKKRIKNKKEQY